MDKKLGEMGKSVKLYIDVILEIFKRNFGHFHVYRINYG